MKILWQIAKVFGISIPVTWVWIEWGREAYGVVFARLALPIYGFFGQTSLMPEGARDRFINYLPFLILMLVTPRLSVVRRAVGIAVGFVLIFALHVAFVWVADEAFTPRGLTQAGYEKFLPIMLLCDAFPLVLWVAIANEFVREMASKVLGNMPTPANPGGDASS